MGFADPSEGFVVALSGFHLALNGFGFCGSVFVFKGLVGSFGTDAFFGVIGRPGECTGFVRAWTHLACADVECEYSVFNDLAVGALWRGRPDTIGIALRDGVLPRFE